MSITMKCRKSCWCFLSILIASPLSLFIENVAFAEEPSRIAPTTHAVHDSQGTAGSESSGSNVKVDTDRSQVLTLYKEAIILEQTQRLDSAAKKFEEAVSLAERVLGADSLDTGMLLVRTGDVYFNLRKPDRAESKFKKALPILLRHLPRDNQDVTYAVNQLAAAYSDLGQFEEAARLHLENMNVRRASLGERHPHTLLSMHNLGMAYCNAAQPQKAIPLLETWLKEDERATSEKWPLYPVVLLNLGGSHLTLRHLDKAEHYLKQALNVVDTRPTSDATTVARILDHLIQLYGLQGASGRDNVIRFGRRATAFCHEQFGDEHSQTATTLHVLGVAHFQYGAFAEAVPLLRESIHIDKKLGKDAINTALYLISADIQVGEMPEAEELVLPAIDNLEALLCKRSIIGVPDIALSQFAEIAQRTGNWDRFQQRAKHLIAAVETTCGKDDPALAHALRLTAGAYWGTNHADLARSHALQALSIQRKHLSSDDSEDGKKEMIEILKCLGESTAALGKYAEAESYHLECLQISRKCMGKNSEAAAVCLCDIGFVYLRMERYEEAETTLRQSLTIAETLGFSGETLAAKASNYLGRLYTDRHNAVKAEAALKRSLELARRHDGPRSGSVAWDLTHLAQFYASVGRFTEAETTFRQSLEVFREVHGNGPFDGHVVLSGLGDTLIVLEKYDEAEKVVRQSLEDFNRSSEINYRDQHIILQSLIELCIRQKRWDEAIIHCTEARRAQRQWLEHVLPAMAPSEQLVYLFQNEKLPLFVSLSVVMRGTDKTKAAEASAEWILNCKARGAECIADQMQLARNSRNPEMRQTVRDLASVREQLGVLLLHSQDKSSAAIQAEQVALCEKERHLARKLGLRMSDSNRATAWVSLADVRKAIGTDSVLIEIVKFPLLTFDAATPASRPTAHYVAWVIPPLGSREVRMIDLGEAAAIDAAIAKSRQEILSIAETAPRLGIGRAARQVEEVSGHLANLVYKPLTAAIGNASTLVVSLDGGLWLFPWEALPVSNDKFLVEQKQIQYVLTGRAILDSAADKLGAGAALFGDPDYDLEPSSEQPQMLDDWLAFARKWFGSNTSGGLLAGARFNRLAEDGKWLDESAPLLQAYTKATPVIYRDKEAAEIKLKAIHSPQVLVVTTHGFFLQDQLFDDLPQTDEGRRVWDAINSARLLGDARIQVPFVPEPLLRCGLALAGANHHYQFRDANDGILTGLEILDLDLHGTELVVLNACETGVGAVRDGEGTAGLYQAFHLAGARVVVASLWRIPSIPFNQLLRTFFANLAKGQTTVAGLRNAQLSMIDQCRKTSGAAHPAMWAAFTATSGCR